MFNNIGSKIKGLATVICVIGIFASCILGLINVQSNPAIGIVIIILGGVLSWLSTYLLYGFGQLIHNSDKIAIYLEHNEHNREKHIHRTESVSINPSPKKESNDDYFLYELDDVNKHYKCTPLFSYMDDLIIPAIHEGTHIAVIQSHAFENNKSLKIISIPDTITTIGDYAFAGCEKLVTINYDGTLEQWCKIEKGTDWDKDTGNYTINCLHE